MKLISPYALWFLSLIPILILMYILKQKYEERQVSSLYLWQQVILDTEAASPFQRLKRNLLFFLQLLILLLCIFAMANPYIWQKNKTYENVVMVVDASGSMSSQGEKDTKLEEAKNAAAAMVNALPSESRITLVTAAVSTKVEILGSTDKKEIVKKLKAIQPTNSAGSIEDVYSLVKAICSQYKSYRVVYFTDNGTDLKGLNGEVVILGPRRPNVSLDYISASKADNGLKVMIRATNYNAEDSDVEICLYAEEKLISIKNEIINSGQTKTVYFDDVPASTRYLYGELSKKDGLMEDNRIYSIVNQIDTKKVLLFSEKNIFLEKALSLFKDIELFKALPGEPINNEFDLYIYDGGSDVKLPQKGNILFINPQKDTPFFKTGQVLGGGKASIATHAITKYMENSDFTISEFRAIDLPYWVSPLLKIGEKPASFAGEYKGRKIAVIGFDLHASDFPLTLEFPVFINNLVSYLVERDTMANTNYFCGEGISITPLPETEKLLVKDPYSQETEISSKYPIRPYEKTYTPGIYEVSQKVGEKYVSKLVAVNFPTSESGFSSVNIENSTTDSSSADNVGGLNLLTSLLMLALLIILLEWAAYLRS